MDIPSIIKLILDNGVTVVIVAMALYFAYQWINSALHKNFEVKKTDISDHSIFAYLKKYIAYKIPSITINTTEAYPFERGRIVKAFLIIKFSTFLEYFSRLNVTQFDKLSPNELHEMLLDNLQEANTEYEKRARQKGIPEIFINKFAIWHQDHINLVIRAMEEFCGSNFINTNIAKVSAVLDVYKIGFHYTLIDAEKTIGRLNGDLTKWIEENPEIMKSI